MSRPPNAERFHVRGYIEQGTTTTPFDMVVTNRMSRYHLAIEALHRVPSVAHEVAALVAQLEKSLTEHAAYIREHGEDMPEVRDWKWTD